MNSEDTIFENSNNKFENEETEMSSNAQQETGKMMNETEDEPVESNKKPFMKKAAAGLGLGVFMGVSAAYASVEETDEGSIIYENIEGESKLDAESQGEISLSDGEVSVASSVSDEMSFSEAFAAAREEVGPGGVFEWNGNVYNTYYAEEWDNMSDEEREEFASHLNVDSEVDVDDNDDQLDEILEGDLVEGNQLEDPSDNEFEITEEVIADNDDDYIVENEDPNVEILGVYEDADSGMNIGVVDVDGQEAFLVDVDGDNDFDYLAADINDDGHLSNYEIADISDMNLTMEMLDVDNDYDDNGFDDESLAFNDMDDDMDYINDADVDDFLA